MPFPLRDSSSTGQPTPRPVGDPAATLLPADNVARGMATDSISLAAGNTMWTLPAEPEPAVNGKPNAEPLPERQVAEWVNESIISGVRAVFAQRDTAPTVLPPAPPAPFRTSSVAPPPLVWTPANARTYSNGAITPAAAVSTLGQAAPAPGVRVTPAGLTNGNSVFRFGATGEPSNFTVLDQGSTNGCGTTSLAMMLNFASGGKPRFSRESVDATIRHFDMFSAPGPIAAYAESKGLQASVRTGASLADLKRTIDQGLPIQVLLDVSAAHDGTGLHYEIVTGYGMGPDGKPYVELANPWGQREMMTEEAFMFRWSDLKVKGFPLGIGQVAITMKPPQHPGKLLTDERNDPFDTCIAGLRVADGLTQVTSGWARRDPATLTGGAVRLIGCGLFGIPMLLGNAGRRWAADRVEEGVAALGKGPAETAKGLGKIVGGSVMWATTATGELVSSAGSAVMDLAARGVTAAGHGIGRLIDRWL